MGTSPSLSRGVDLKHKNITIISPWSTRTARNWDERMLLGGNDLMMWLDEITDICSFPSLCYNLDEPFGATAEWNQNVTGQQEHRGRTDHPWCVEKQTMSIYLLTKGQSVSLHPSANTKDNLGHMPRVTAWDRKYVVPNFLHKWSHRKWFVFACWESNCAKASPNYNYWRDQKGMMSLWDLFVFYWLLK